MIISLVRKIYFNYICTLSGWYVTIVFHLFLSGMRGLPSLRTISITDLLSLSLLLRIKTSGLGFKGFVYFLFLKVFATMLCFLFKNVNIFRCLYSGIIFCKVFNKYGHWRGGGAFVFFEKNTSHFIVLLNIII